MFRARVTRKFLKNPARVTLTLLLAVSSGMAMRLPVVAQASGWQRVVFTERKDPANVINTYPFLKDAIQVAQRAPDTGVPKELKIASVRSQKKKIKLLFVFMKDSNDCGSGGCGLNIYANEGKGYKEVNGFLTFEPDDFYVSTEGSTVSIFWCANEGEWNLKNHAFVGPVHAKNPPACH